jgi:uncharacterized protein (DUF433 family)
MHGEPCFQGTRVPIQALFDHLRAGESLADFLKGFPDVREDQAVAVIDLASMVLVEDARKLWELYSTTALIFALPNFSRGMRLSMRATSDGAN